MRWGLITLSASMLAVTVPGCAAVGRVTDQKVRCSGAAYLYEMFVPDGLGPLPALVLLHGAGDSPEPMVGAWKTLAAEKHIVLIAPELPRELKFESVAPGVFVCMVEDGKRLVAVGGQQTIDARRVYVFGNSMGGYLAYDAALLRSDYFAAAGIHAMGIDKGYAGIVGRAVRKTPIAIYAGMQDPLVPVEKVRETRDLLMKQGFSLHYVEIDGHDHNYYALSDAVNGDAWKFMEDKRLPEVVAGAGIDAGKM